MTIHPPEGPAWAFLLLLPAVHELANPVAV
jgi:hypothetical protein